MIDRIPESSKRAKDIAVLDALGVKPGKTYALPTDSALGRASDPNLGSARLMSGNSLGEILGVGCTSFEGRKRSIDATRANVHYLVTLGVHGERSYLHNW